jgi:biopolymer transport protein ExbB/TolQ
MNCTAFGLMTAIVCLVSFGLLNNWTQGMIEDINAASVQVLNLVVNNRSKIHLDESQAA